MPNQGWNTDLTSRTLKNRVVDCDVVLDLVDGKDEREISDRLRHAARQAESVHVAPVSEINLRLIGPRALGRVK